MLSTLLVFTFAASTFGSPSSHITTSIWMYADDLISDKIGYGGAVIDVQGDRTTLGLIPDENISDQTALGLATYQVTVTVAPTYYGEGLTVRSDFLNANTAKPVVEAGRIDCTKSATGDVGALCTVSYGPILGYLKQCQPEFPNFATATSTVAKTITHSYSSRGSYSAGAETFTKVDTVSPYTGATPSWCNGNATSTIDMRTTETFSAPKERFPMAQLTLTWGLEKLPTSTSSTASATQNRGASMPVQTVGPVIAGLVVAAAFVV